MALTAESDITAFAVKLWESGRLPSALITGERLFPLSMPLKGPSAAELIHDLASARRWAEALRKGSKKERGAGYSLEYKTVRPAPLGPCELPSRAVIETEEDALTLASRKKEARALLKLVSETTERLPALLSFIVRRPLKALEEKNDWSRYIDICLKLLAEPRPGSYLRELDLPGIDTKFMETRKKLLSELLDLVLPPASVDKSRSPGKFFEERYGFRRAPELIRLRLPSDCAIFPKELTELSLAAEEFAKCPIPCEKVLVVENLATFLAVLRLPGVLVLWGKGYGFSALSAASWLAAKELYYWGDIDTHGLSILAEFRSHFPATRSLLMDEATLLAFRELCVTEEQQASSLPAFLTQEEAALFSALKNDDWGIKLRLEQERLPISQLRASLEKLPRRN